MTEGITILNKVAVTGLPSWIMVSATVLFIIGVLIFIVDIIADCNWPVWTAVFLLIGWLILVVTIFLDITITTDKYRYECIIDDSVSYNEVVENYKIIEQRGDICVLEDK